MNSTFTYKKMQVGGGKRTKKSNSRSRRACIKICEKIIDKVLTGKSLVPVNKTLVIAGYQSELEAGDSKSIFK